MDEFGRANFAAAKALKKSGVCVGGEDEVSGRCLGSSPLGLREHLRFLKDQSCIADDEVPKVFEARDSVLSFQGRMVLCLRDNDSQNGYVLGYRTTHLLEKSSPRRVQALPRANEVLKDALAWW